MRDFRLAADPYNVHVTSMAAPLLLRRLGETALMRNGGAGAMAPPIPMWGAVEHQFYAIPAVNTGIQSERDLWNAP